MRRFRKTGTIPDGNPLDLWGGPEGELPSIWMSTGSRKGGSSRMYRHDKGAGASVWVDDGAPPDAETLAKIVSDSTRVYAFYETHGPAAAIAREITTPGWSFVGPTVGENFVGGHGLAVSPTTLYIGGSAEWTGDRRGELWSGPPAGSLAVQRTIEPGINWETLVTPEGEVWEFWHAVAGTETPGSTYSNGEALAAPTENVACAAAFLGEMYAGGDLDARSTTVWRWSGSGWVGVLTMAGMVEHLVAVPRDPPIFFAVCQHPLEVWESEDGATWVQHDEVEPMETNLDTNNLCALGYHNKIVWLAARDDAANRIQVWADGGGDDLNLQVI